MLCASFGTSELLDKIERLWQTRASKRQRSCEGSLMGIQTSIKCRTTSFWSALSVLSSSLAVVRFILLAVNQSPFKVCFLCVRSFPSVGPDILRTLNTAGIIVIKGDPRDGDEEINVGGRFYQKIQCISSSTVVEIHAVQVRDLWKSRHLRRELSHPLRNVAQKTIPRTQAFCMHFVFFSPGCHYLCHSIFSRCRFF